MCHHRPLRVLLCDNRQICRQPQPATRCILKILLTLQELCATMAHSVLAQQTLLKSISVGTGSVHKATTLSKHGSVSTPTKASPAPSGQLICASLLWHTDPPLCFSLTGFVVLHRLSEPSLGLLLGTPSTLVWTVLWICRSACTSMKAAV